MPEKTKQTPTQTPSPKTPTQNFSQTNSPSVQNLQPSVQNPQLQTQQSPVESARQRLQAVESALNKIVIGHEDAVRALMLALVAKEHVVMIGPPGTAKTMLATTTAKLLEAKTYTYLMTRFTTFDELFGPIDVIGLQNNELRRRWSRIVEAELIFLDEVFKANSAILNSLLSIMQERVVYDPMTGEPIGVRLWTLVAASNEIPTDEELQALYDRFGLKVFINYLDDDHKILAALRARWQSGEVQPVASMNDVRTLHEFAVTLLQRGKTKIGEILQLFYLNAVPLVRALRSKGIILSDRTVVSRLPMLFAATLALYGITPENLSGAIYDILPLTARSPQEAADIRRAIDETLGEVAELTRRIEQAKMLIKADRYDEALKLLKEVATYDVSKLKTKPWLKPRVEALTKLAQDYIQKIQEHLERARMLKESL